MMTIKNKKGDILLGYVVTFPLIILLMTYIVSSGAFFTKQNEMYNIVNNYHDRSIRAGYFLSLDILTEGLEEKGFSSDYLNIQLIGDNGNAVIPNQQIQIGEEMRIIVVYERPHAFYYINNVLIGSFTAKDLRSNFMINVDFMGLSERWHN